MRYVTIMSNQVIITVCPICGEPIDRDKHEIMGKLSQWGYLHVDFWVRCPKCKYSPCFGQELSDATPIYWHPAKLPAWYKTACRHALEKHIPPFICLFCQSTMELHKVYVNSYRALCDGATEFVVPSSGIKEQAEHPVVRRFLPSGILAQYKCVNARCKYVRYVTL